MKYIVEILSSPMAIFAMWVSLLQMSVVPRTRTWLVRAAAYLFNYILTKDISEAKEFMKQREVDVGPTTVTIPADSANFCYTGYSR